MKTHSLLILALVGQFCASVSQAQMIFDVTLDSSPLQGHSSAPFSLDFQLNDGSGSLDGNNSVTIDHFDFHGGSWTGPNSFTITDTTLPAFGPANIFTAGSLLSFRVTLTTQVDAGGTPDQFSFAILDKNNAEIPTQGLGDAFVSVDIDSVDPMVSSFRTDLGRTGIDIGAPTITAVPEPVGVGLLAGSLCIIVVGVRVTRLSLSRAALGDRVRVIL
jgi:hypothetical protein